MISAILKPGYELFAFKIDCIYLIFLKVFDISCLDLGGSIEHSLDPPKLFPIFAKITNAKVAVPPKYEISRPLCELSLALIISHIPI